MFTIVQSYLHSEHKDPALYLKEEQSLEFVRSYEIRLKRLFS